MKSTYFAKKARVTLKIIFGHITAYSWSHYNFIESHITSLFMVTLQAYLWSHYKLIHNLAILLFFVISTTVKTYLLGKSVAVLFNTPQFISYNAKGADIKLPECTFNTLYTSYTLYTCLQIVVYRSPTI